jgi:hypothetical protein
MTWAMTLLPVALLVLGLWQQPLVAMASTAAHSLFA